MDSSGSIGLIIIVVWVNVLYYVSGQGKLEMFPVFLFNINIGNLWESFRIIERISSAIRRENFKASRQSYV